MSLPPIEAAEVIARARRRLRRKRDVPVERLRDDRFASYLLRVWDEACEDLVRRASIAPDLRNTDDQPILLTVDRFDVTAGGRLRVEAALRELGMEESSARDGGTVFRLTRPDERLGAARNTIVGLARVGDGLLKLETNSIERADRLRAQLEAGCGGLIQHRVRSHTDPLSAALPAGDTAPPRPQGPEIDKIVRQHKEQHYSTWPDEPIPALDGETPRAAVRTKAGRERVEVLIKDLERAESREPPGMRYDTTPLRRELGLDTDTL